ncbi:MAG: hypothetical protein IKC09_07185 [Oscillospiraceae bacterium]|nr:hypothetical protein [Oscillospiraceae bacterium]
MKPETLSEALGQIEGHYINEAITYKRSRLGWIPWTAACAAFFLFFSILINHPDPTEDPWGSSIVATTPGPLYDYYSDGIPLSLPLVTDGDGLITESVSVKLDVQEFPGGFHDLQSYLEFQSTAVMELTFRNPTTEPLTVNLTLPCGKDPMYAFRRDYETKQQYYHADRDRYQFCLDGKAVPATFRATGSDTLPEAEGTWHTWHIHENTTVTKYTCRVTELEDREDSFAAIWGPGAYSDIIGVVERNGAYQTINGNSKTLLSTALGDTLEVYIIGDAPDYRLGWFFVSGSIEQTPIRGTAELIDTQVMTFLEFSNQSWQSDHGISRSDWAYVFAGALDRQIFNARASVDFSYPSWNPFRWYEYELTVEPGATVVHKVSLPLYPSLLLGAESTECVYTLDLKTLERLCVTGSQNLTLTTPIPMTESSAEFTISDSQYVLDLSGLSGAELSFTLSRQWSVSPDSNYGFLWISAALGGFAGFLLWHLICRRKT